MQRSSLTNDSLGDILETPTSYMTPEYDKRLRKTAMISLVKFFKGTRKKHKYFL